MTTALRQLVLSVSFDSSVRRFATFALALAFTLIMNSPVGGGPGA